MIDDNPKLKFLSKVPPQNNFGFSNGKVAEDIQGLYDIIKGSDDNNFYEHVNDTKNDFANWIRSCVLHIELADKLYNIKKKEDFLQALGQEIETIKNYSIAPVVPTASVNLAPPISSPIIQSVPAASAVPASSPAPSNQTTNPVAILVEEIFEFEEIFKSLIDELEKEIFSEQ
jgi:hypothetical protein